MTSPETPATPPIPPRPAYGEYASPEHAEAARQALLPPAPQQPDPYAAPPQPYTQQPYGQPPLATGPRPVRRGDMIASIILLVVGFFVTIWAIFNALTLTMQFELLYESYGLSDYEPSAGISLAAAVIIISHLVLLAIAGTVTPLLIRKRRVSFWVPLVAGAIAGLVMLVTTLVILSTDSKLMEVITQQSQL